jgi:hypothetical protein
MKKKIASPEIVTQSMEAMGGFAFGIARSKNTTKIGTNAEVVIWIYSGEIIRFG